MLTDQMNSPGRPDTGAACPTPRSWGGLLLALLGLLGSTYRALMEAASNLLDLLSGGGVLGSLPEIDTGIECLILVESLQSSEESLKLLELPFTIIYICKSNQNYVMF